MFVEPLPDRFEAGGVKFEMMTKGSGRPLLFLHAGHGIDAKDPMVERLSANFKVIAASHPGFGLSERPETITNVDDIVYAYLDLVEKLDLKDAVLVGASFGAWIAAELAVRGTGRFSQLVLLNPVGIKVSDREHRDFVDIFGRVKEELPAILFSDPNLPEAVSTRFARNA